MKSFFKRLFGKPVICSHKFDLEDICGRESSGEDVTWVCWKCGKVFHAHCGLDILNHGRPEKKPAGFEPESKEAE